VAHYSTLLYSFDTLIGGVGGGDDGECGGGGGVARLAWLAVAFFSLFISASYSLDKS
jgi:hypothetical protein